MSSIESDFQTDLEQIQAESIGWIPLEEGAYLHVGSDDTEVVITVQATTAMAGANVLRVV